MSGNVLVAGAPQATIGASPNEGAVFLFTKGRRGWASETETAHLIVSKGTGGDYFGTFVAISGDTVVAGAAGPAACTLDACPYEPRSGYGLYVFSKPRRGWHGTVTERATLTVTAPGFRGFGWIAISGNTIVALPLSIPPGNGQRSTLWVFTKPVAGWSGTILPSATLTLDTGVLKEDLGPSLAISGQDIFATGWTSATQETDAVFVFQRPRRGWTGTIHARARLMGAVRALSRPDLWPIATLGPVAVAGGYGPGGALVADLFTRPKHGWPRTVPPIGRLTFQPAPYGGEISPSIGALAASSDTIAALVLGPYGSSCYPTHICAETLYTFKRPAHGWTGAIKTESHVSVAVPLIPSSYPLAIAGHMIATSGDGAIDIFAQTIPKAPRAT